MNKTDLWAGISVMGALCFMLFLYAPLELFFYNQREFWFDLYTLFPFLLVLFGVAFLAMVLFGVLCCLLLPKVYKVVVIPALSIVLLGAYVQGNFLLNDLPPMDGLEYDWADYSAGRLPSVILWVAISILVIVSFRILRGEKFCRVARAVSLFLSAMLLLTLVSICITTEGYRTDLDACATVKDEFEYSENSNFIILLIDAADSGEMYTMLQEKPEYKETFEDFTYYHNTLGIYPCTMCAIPQIISGQRFENQTDFDTYATDVFKNAEFLDILEQQNYKLGMYYQDLTYNDESIYRFENVLPITDSVSSWWDLAKLEIKLVGLRYAPFDLKRFCEFKHVEFSATRIMEVDYPIYLPSNEIFYNSIKESDFSYISENCFKFIHLEGAHVPFHYDKDMNRIEKGTYRQAMEASMTVTKAYLEKLKENGLYDNSVIVVMADHGMEGLDPALYTGRQNPILFVKGIDEHHEMVISEAPISYDDLQTAFRRLLEGSTGTEIFDYQEGDERERTYLFYEYEEEDYLYEYTTSGHASDDSSLQATGREFVR